MYLLYIINRDSLPYRSTVVSQEDNDPLDRIDLADAARVLLIRTAGLACIGSEVEKRDFRMLSGADGLVDEVELLIQKNLLALGQLNLVVGQPARLCDDAVEAGERGEG